MMISPKHTRIGFISTRFSGTDGVSLETAKWVSVLDQLGYECFFFAGESEWPDEYSYLVPEAHFAHPDIRTINTDLFDKHRRHPDTSIQVSRLKDYLKDHLKRFIQRFQPQVLIIENAVSLPMNIPLGLAITEVIAESCVPAIAHHHDFAWERERYAIDSASDYLRAAFPPTLDQINHVVINSYAENQLALYAGVSSTVIPNVMDFDTPPPEPGSYCSDLRQRLGIKPGQFMLLQPTRIIPRKRIEKAIELVRWLDEDCVLVVTHGAGDEGQDYKNYLIKYAQLMNVDMLLVADRFAPHRKQGNNGDKIYSLFDVYQEADLVTYPSQIEGFGNALLEAIYCRKPIVTSTYRILKTDIQPKGFKFLELDEFFHPEFVSRIRQVLHKPELAREMVERNYEVGRRHFSYETLEARLATLLGDTVGC